MPGIDFPNYEDLGFDKWMKKPFGSDSSTPQIMQEINFDQMQTSGSLGDRIQVGGSNIQIDGTNKRISINDGNSDRVIIGEL